MTTLADTIAATLDLHAEVWTWAVGTHCLCGARSTGSQDAPSQHAAHRAHVATVLAEQEAQRRKAERAARGGAL